MKLTIALLLLILLPACSGLPDPNAPYKYEPPAPDRTGGITKP